MGDVNPRSIGAIADSVFTHFDNTAQTSPWHATRDLIGGNELIILGKWALYCDFNIGF